MKSLFIVSLPRSLSSFIYQTTKTLLQLREPSWTSDGEILNPDRFILNPRAAVTDQSYYYTKKSEEGRYSAALDFLDHVVQPQHFIYKDVVQPFIVEEWLRRGGVNVLKIKRPIADVVFSMRNRKWWYPANGIPNGDMLAGLIKGLLDAEKTIDTVEGKEVYFDRFIEDEQYIEEILGGIYPGVKLRPFKYLDGPFTELREKYLERRQKTEYRIIQKKISSIASML